MAPAYLRIRWLITALVVAMACTAYVQRTGIAIAAERIMPELGISQVQFGWLVTVFLALYTAFQLPGAVVGAWLGARRALTAVGIVGLLATAMTVAAPVVATGFAVFATLLVARALLGVGQAALFPVSSGAFASWLPVERWGFAQGLQVGCAWIAAAATPPMVAILMERFGWQAALAYTSAPAILLTAVWYGYGRDRPHEHPGIPAGELVGLALTAPVAERPTLARMRALLGNRQLLLVTLSYLLTNYVFYLVTFWCFLYLVQERKFSVLESGWLASVPFLVAAVASTAGGSVSDWLVSRLGEGRGRRLLPVTTLPLAAAFLYLTVTAADPYCALVALSLAFAAVELNEGPVWAAAMRVAPADAMASTGVLNTGGNLGGVLATPVIAFLSAQGDWHWVFITGAALSLASAVLWLWIDASKA